MIEKDTQIAFFDSTVLLLLLEKKVEINLKDPQSRYNLKVKNGGLQFLLLLLYLWL